MEYAIYRTITFRYFLGAVHRVFASLSVEVDDFAVQHEYACSLSKAPSSEPWYVIPLCQNQSKPLLGSLVVRNRKISATEHNKLFAQCLLPLPYLVADLQPEGQRGISGGCGEAQATHGVREGGDWPRLIRPAAK